MPILLCRLDQLGAEFSPWSNGIQIDVGSLDELTDYLAPSIGSGDFQFFTESNWKVTRYRQLAIHESEEEWLASGFIVNDSGE